jgi:hypothetical protein
VSVFDSNYKNLGGYNPNDKSCVSNGYGTVCTDHWKTVGNGQFVDIKVSQADNRQPQYVELEQVANDAICLAYVTQVWPDGNKFGWVGDWGRHCGANW